MRKDYRFINAGTIEVYSWSKKDQDRLNEILKPRGKYYKMFADFGIMWSIGTNTGKYGEYAKYQDTCFSVNKDGYICVKVGTPKGNKFVELIKDMINLMKEHENEEAIDTSKKGWTLKGYKLECCDEDDY